MPERPAPPPTGPERPSVTTLAWAFGSGGLYGGTLVGLAEAAWLLSTTTPAEYQALPYACALYGLVGAAIGAVLALLASWPAARLGVRPAVAWSAGFSVVASGVGLVVFSYVLDKAAYLERGLPGRLAALVLGVGVLATVMGTWVGSVVFVKTPLRVLPRPKGTVVGWLLLAGLSWLFSLSPAPGLKRTLAPHRTPAADAAQKPDVLLIMVDTLRADALGAYGAGPDASPAIDRLAHEGIVFETAIAQSSWTRASTASLFTSTLPSTHGCLGKEGVLPQGLTTLAEALQAGGYATGGLPDNPNISGTWAMDQGFDWYPFEMSYPFGARASTYQLSLYAGLRRLVARQREEKRVGDHYLPAEKQLSAARQFIDAQGGDRWFLFVHLMEPHDPYFEHPENGRAYARAEHPHPDLAEADTLRALYAGEVRHLDEELGRFLDELRRSGAYEHTLIVLTSDHGEEFGEHGGFWHGATLYDEAVHVPLIVKLPHQARSGTRVPWQVRLLDVAPTIVELAQVDRPGEWQGQALVGDDFDAQLAAGGAPEAGVDWAGHPASLEAVSEQDFEGYALQSLRAKGRKLIRATAVPAGNLRQQPPLACYDLRDDPAETTDLAGTSCDADLVPWLESLLDAARTHAVPDRVVPVGARSEPGLQRLGYQER